MTDEIDDDVDQEVVELLSEIIAPHFRYQARLEAMDPRASEILMIHAAVAQEVDIALQRAVIHPEHLAKLNFSHKLSVLAASTNLEPHVIDRWLKPARALIELRNAVAHPTGH